MRTLYVSYDGMLDPLGRSQVLPYLRGLAARGARIVLVSFEKVPLSSAARRTLADELRAAGILWHPLRYHRRLRLLATLFDVVVGTLVVGRLSRSWRPEIIHCRGDVAMAIGRAGASGRERLLYDVRGFFRDERVESGSWRAGSLTDRIVFAVERGNLAAADGLVVLTAPAVEVLAAKREPLPPFRVIPTCVDLDLFEPRPPDDPPEFGLVYSGSLGTWYMTDEILEVGRRAQEAGFGRTLYLTRDSECIRGRPEVQGSDVRGAEPAEVPGWLRKGRAAFFFIRPTPAKLASSPTKLAEALACGLPILCNRGIGEVDAVVEREGIGVLVESFRPHDLHAALQRLLALTAHDDIAGRCRRVAKRVFGLPSGVDAYMALYQEICKPPRFPRPASSHESGSGGLTA